MGRSHSTSYTVSASTAPFIGSVLTPSRARSSAVRASALDLRERPREARAAERREARARSPSAHGASPLSIDGGGGRDALGTGDGGEGVEADIGRRRGRQAAVPNEAAQEGARL